VPDDAWAPQEVAETHERQAIVQRAIARLTEEQRTVLVLFDIQGLTYEEIAATLSVPVGTVKSRLKPSAVGAQVRPGAAHGTFCGSPGVKQREWMRGRVR
jgi:DNA-directed RNA polymerase specialized sigma subunit